MIGDDSGTSAALSDVPLFEHLHPSCFGGGFVLHLLHLLPVACCLLPVACLTPLVYTFGYRLSIVLRGNLSYQNIIKIIAVWYGLGIVPGITSYALVYQTIEAKMPAQAL